MNEISTGSLIAVDGAFQTFARQIRSSLPGKRRGYGVIFGSDCYKHIRRERMAPTFTSMLQQSQALGVSLVHILSDPAGAAKAAGELALASQVFIIYPPIRISNETIQAIRSRLNKEIRNSSKTGMSSFKALAQEFNVLPGTIVYHLGDLAITHKIKRKAFLAEQSRTVRERLYQVLDAGLIEEYRAKRIRSIDDLARKASASAETGIGAARRAISQRLGIKWCC